jgi:hypothetical protein
MSRQGGPKERNLSTKTRKGAENTKKIHVDIFSHFVLSYISPAQLNLYTFNRGDFVISVYFLANAEILTSNTCGQS